MFKKHLVVLFLLLSFFLFPKFSLAQSPTISPAPPYTCYFQKYTDPGFFAWLWDLILSLFSKPYDIDTNREPAVVRRDMPEYGNLELPEYKDKHSYVGSRATSNKTQDCLKGEIMKKVLLNQINDDIIGYICLTNNSTGNNNCTNDQIKRTSNLAHFLLQTNQNFICDENFNKIPTPSDLIAKINSLYSTPIPSYELPCYDGVYNDFFLTPKNPPNPNEEENTIQIMKTPLPNQYQNTNDNAIDLKRKNELNFSTQKDIDNNKASLKNLVPAKEQ